MRQLGACLLGLWCGTAQAEEVESVPVPVPVMTVEELNLAANPQPDRGISAYEPVYFSFGGNWLGEGDINAKFQVSLKYRILHPEDAQAPRWWEQVYLGYTQTSIWDWESDSAPFRDSAYRPAVFFERPELANFTFMNSLLGLRAGFEHESNGKSEDDSRSINTLFIRPSFTFPATPRGYVWSLSPKLYAYLEKEDNADIADYRGYADFAVKLTNPNDWEVITVLRKGMKDNHASLQVDASFPLRGWLRNLNGFLHLQYFNGYGETILDYNHKLPSQLRIGLIVVR